MKKFLIILSLLFVSGCGYKPSAHYIQSIFDGSIYVDVKVSSKEPENAVYVKDALHRMIITRFGGKVTPREHAQNIIVASYEGTSFVPISYDENGYITRYRANIRMKFNMKSKDVNLNRNITAYVEEDIHASSSLSSALRILAIRKGMEKALDQFLAYAASQGAIQKSAE